MKPSPICGTRAKSSPINRCSSAWAGKPLASGAQVFWQVRIWDKDGQPSAWSDTASFELGLLASATEWKGQWITADLPRYDADKPSLADASWITASPAAKQDRGLPLQFRSSARTSKIRSAVVDISAEGGFTLYVNGRQARQASNRPNGWKKPTRAISASCFRPAKICWPSPLRPPAKTALSRTR